MDDLRGIPVHIEQEIAEFERQADLYMRQVVTDKEFTPIQRLHGVYDQAQSNCHMVRIKIPSGILTWEQLLAMADIARNYSSNQSSHITVRQNFQIYGVALESMGEIMRQLAEVGLTTREACGNTVRNVKCCPFGGLHEDAPFDPTPYALAVTQRFLRSDDIIAVREDGEKTFFKLPRKFKITFGGCCGDEDCGQATINDIGFLAATRRVEGKVVHGFEMRVGGGLAAQPRQATVLVDFVPADQVLPWVEAVLRVFAMHGNYDPSSRGRAHARLKHLIGDKGWEWFQDEARKARATLPNSMPIELPLPETIARSAVEIAPLLKLASDQNGEYRRWFDVNTRAQLQDGVRVCYATVPLGDLSAEQMQALSRAAVRCGDGTIRLTDQQNILFRWVRQKNVPHLYAELRKIGLAEPQAGLIGDITSCPGADTCRIGITSSRGLARDLKEFVDGTGDEELGRVHIKISGCPNSCGQHHLATIGFHGGAQSLTVDGQKKQIPSAMLLLGGKLTRSGATLARRMLVLPARRIKDALPLLAELYRETRSGGESFEQWAGRVDKSMVIRKLEPLTRKDPADAELFIDAGKTKPFTFEVK